MNEAPPARRRKRSALPIILWLGCGAAAAAVALLIWSPGQLSLQSAEALGSRVASLADPALAAVVQAPDPMIEAVPPVADQDRTIGDRNGQHRRGAVNRVDGAIPVITTTAHASDIPVSLDALGTVTPLAMVMVKPQLSGYLTQVAFTEGQMVKRGDFLAQIDPRPYQIALEQAQRQLANDQALRREADIDLERYQKLSAQDSIAR